MLKKKNIILIFIAALCSFMFAESNNNTNELFNPNCTNCYDPIAEAGQDLTYYKELYSKDREKTLDSLKQLRPKFKTKKGRTVYGGGGITPDIHIAYKSDLTKSTQEILRNPERPIFNFSSTYATEND